MQDEHSRELYGIVEARVNGLWGRICLENFAEKEANVTCRMMGYQGGVPYIHVTRDNRPVVISNLRCSGTENSIFDCQHELWADPNVCPKTDYEAGVICYNNTGNYVFAAEVNY